MWWLHLAAPAGACDLDSLDLHLEQAEKAFVARDSEGLAAAVEMVDHELSCIRTAIPPLWCARVHFVHALAEWRDPTPNRALASLRAAHHAEPLFRLPEDVIPPGHAMHQLSWQAEELADTWTPSTQPVRIDGLPSAAVPQGHPYVLQKITRSGALGARRVDPLGGRTEGGGGGALRWAAVGTGAVGLALLGAAQLNHVAYYDAVDAGDWDEAARRLPRTNGLSVAWAATGGAAATMFAVSFAL